MLDSRKKKMKFHRRCGDRVTLLNDNSTAIRNFVEFNHGLILSAEPISDDVMFEVCIDRKVNVWNGSLEIGVTTLDPEFMELPATATKLRNTAWIMSGSSIVKDGVTLVNSYGPELDTLREGDCLGVMRTSKAELTFYINGRCLGVAAKDLPPRLFAVIDLYGQCVQVSISQVNGLRTAMELCLVQAEEDPNNDDTLTSSEIDVAGLPSAPFPKETQNIYVPMSSEGACSSAQDHLRFHPRCGILVKLSGNNKTAERARPLDDYNNGVVMTHRPLYDNELFEIRIDRLVDKWSGSVEVGVTTHNPATIRFPSTMTNMDSGTIMMSGCKVLLNGHGTCMEYGNFNLDELREAETVGLLRKSNGELHYFINGVDQGVATDKVEPQVWGVVDLYGMTVKVSIVDPCEDMDSNIQHIPQPMNAIDIAEPRRFRPAIDEDSLLFHTLRDSNVIIINDGKTAHRPNAFEFFNNGVVMTNRTLRTNELFQVRLDLIIPKWAGSIEIGVTQHTASEFEFPFRMSNAKSGTWAITGEDVIRDGTIIIPQYVRNLNRLVEGDTVGVMRKDMGILHFYVNGIDQGPAAFNIPEHVFGIIDLYGRVAQATIVDIYLPPPVHSPDSPVSTESNATVNPEMCFHRVHGRNARLSRNRLTASRATVYSEFNDAVLFSSRPLRECDMFELRIDKMVDCWIGSLEIGVTAIRPDDLEATGGVGAVAGTATDLNWDTYILSGAAMMKDGECVRSGYPLDLDTLTVGSRVGMMWHADRSLHYYLDGMDMGKAWYVPHLNIYAVVDLYGQCTQVTILQNEERAFNYNGCTNSDNSLMGNTKGIASPPYWSFSEYCGENVCMMHGCSVARRLTPDPTYALVFSSAHLAVGEMFEIKIVECKSSYAGSFRMGITDVNILNAHVNRSLPLNISRLPHFTAYIDGKYMKYSKAGCSVKEKDMRSFVPSFEWLRTGDRLGLKKTSDFKVLVYYNSELLDVAFEKVPDKVFAVMELCGPVTKIHTISMAGGVAASNTTTIPNKSIPKRQPQLNEDGTICPVSTSANMDRETDNQFGIGNEPSTSNTESNKNVRENLIASIDTANTESNTMSTLTVVPTETRRRRNPLPYTFHYVHGKNIKLCSSDTVAVRTSGYKDGLAIISQPLRRGHSFRFRIDKVMMDWLGSVGIGAVGHLASEELPPTAMQLEPPVWVITSDLIYDNGDYIKTKRGAPLDNLTEQSVLTIHFRLNSDIAVDIDSEPLGVIGAVSRNACHVFPLIDLYGRVTQVSVLLHPHVVVSGTSIDLPIIAENQREESMSDLDMNEEPTRELFETNLTEMRIRRKLKAYSHDNLIEDELEPIAAQPGPSSRRDILPLECIPLSNFETKNPAIRRKRQCPNQLSLHQSLIMSDNTMSSNSCDTSTSSRFIHKSHSSHNFSLIQDDIELKVLRHTYSVGSQIADHSDSLSHGQFYDTNIRHNDRYPEANDVDNLDNEIMDALTLETGNLPDLTEEQSSSLDESTRRDELWSEQLSIENLNYLNRILCFDQEMDEGQSLESEWEASGEGCEHLHLVLKYWNFLVCPYPELRKAVSWGQVRCYCSNCQPDLLPPFAGWVRIERIDGVGAAQRGFWNVSRNILGSAQAAHGESGSVRRPRALVDVPCTSTSFSDIWIDEEGKPHQTVLAIEIDIEGSEAANDRLLSFLIYLKPHSYSEENPPSLDD
ncbi:neuralized-like protein 4 isoform X1 [Bombyx mandarina]|uniref:Neuralized-like protein 4 isoform X1 n=2 Tax=Bombyx mandarina TaxID=7092 RepID=A0A6J2JUL2_BOMMA|nr:neuralized-like protein 4 isoform X1 [Bombyx mandarina]